MTAAPKCSTIRRPHPGTAQLPRKTPAHGAQVTGSLHRDAGSGRPALRCRAGLSGFADPGAGLEGTGEGVEGSDAVAGGGGEAGPDRAELLGAGRGPLRPALRAIPVAAALRNQPSCSARTRWSMACPPSRAASAASFSASSASMACCAHARSRAVPVSVPAISSRSRRELHKAWPVSAVRHR
jgi:hypothetical protein